VDELRYLFLASQVELVETAETAKNAPYYTETDLVTVGIVEADGEKCDRCWNYSTQVGTFEDHPTICERCHEALAGNF
jgi:isoleucyl-tRNA synthetase